MEKTDLENQLPDLKSSLSENSHRNTGVLIPNAYSLKPEKKSNGCLECCGVCCSMLFGLALIAGCVAYFVFGIMYLVQDYNVANDCGGSSFCAYVLTAIILAWGRSGAKNASTDSQDVGGRICMLVCLGLLETGLAIWGGIELWDKSCDDLQESNIWKFGLATFCLQSFCGFIFLVLMPLIIGIMMCNK
jgi:hypothetical protein